MKSKRFAFLNICMLLCLIVIITQVNANGVLVPTNYTFLFLYFLMILYALLITCVIEGLIIIFFIRKHNFTSSKLYIFILKINLFTFLLAQTIAPIILNTYFPYWVYYQTGTDLIIKYVILYIFIDSIPILLECGFYLRFYLKLNRELYFTPPVKIKTIILSTITANLVSAIFGIIFSIFLIGRI